MNDTRLDHLPDPLIGSLVGARYRVVRELGTGGMAVVYEGEHEDLGRRVAIKVIRHELVAHAPDAVDRFLQEARTASRLQHPSVVDVFDLGRLDDGRPFMVMPLLKGMDLERMLRERGPRPPEEVAKLLVGPASALDAMHAQGIVHRDIKLENLFLECHDDGHEAVRLMDFGLAAMSGHGSRMTRDGMVLGTPHYMAPEVARGNKAKAAADIYGLATLAYELIAGVLPFDDEEPVRLMATKLVQDAPLLSMQAASTPALDAVFADALARDPARRPKTCGELVEGIARACKRPGTLETEALFDGPSPVDRRADEASSVSVPNAVPSDRADVRLGTEERAVLTRSRGPLVAGVVLVLLALGGVAVWMSRTDVEASTASMVPAPVVPTAIEPTTVEPTTETPAPTTAALVATNDAPIAEAEATVEATMRPPVDRTRTVASSASEMTAMTPTATTPTAMTENGTTQTTPSAMTDAASTTTTTRSSAMTSSESAVTSAEALERAQALNREAQSLALRGLFPAAVERYREATSIAPRFAVPWRGLGIAHQGMRQNAEAKRAFERYLQLAPNAPDAPVIRERAAAL